MSEKNTNGLSVSFRVDSGYLDHNNRVNIICVRRTSNYTAERGTYTDTTKTKRSQRTLKIADSIMDMLKELKAEQDEQALKYGDKWVETDRLYTKWNGEPMNNQTPYGWLKEFCEKNDLPFYGLHSFRHFAASALISAGLDVTTVSGALGHSCQTTTVNLPKGHTTPSSHIRQKSAESITLSADLVIFHYQSIMHCTQHRFIFQTTI